MFTNTTRGSSRLSARSQTRVVCTSTPITALATTSAPSTTRSAAIVSPLKPASPGLSIRLILRPCHSRWQSDDASDIWRRCSSSSQSEVVVPPSTVPSRLIAPAWKSIASTSEVFPVPRWPTTATFRIFPGSIRADLRGSITLQGKSSLLQQGALNGRACKARPASMSAPPSRRLRGSITLQGKSSLLQQGALNGRAGKARPASMSAPPVCALAPYPGRSMWWRDAVVYQIYPRSFQDSDGDGIGDLRGIAQRLDHLSYLGVDALWLSPIYPSPLADFGYDVSDYTDVDPVFGTLADLDELIGEAHRRGLRLLLDLVLSHTSIEHPWFREHPDWYIWSPVDGPPNNWTAAFGGPAWSRDEKTGRWYLHTFYPEQPDLDWRNPEVVAAMQEVMRFWLDRGVDGFRVDALNVVVKDEQLRDDPPATAP